MSFIQIKKIATVGCDFSGLILENKNCRRRVSCSAACSILESKRKTVAITHNGVSDRCARELKLSQPETTRLSRTVDADEVLTRAAGNR
jgi:phosphoribosylanthranilate isomerase